MRHNCLYGAPVSTPFHPSTHGHRTRPESTSTPRHITLPQAIAAAGERAATRFVEFFTANIRNANTRAAYARAVASFFAWLDQKGIRLDAVSPIVVAAYIETHPGSDPSRKLALAAIRMLFDYLVTGQVLNPASSVKGPRHVVRRGKTPVLDQEQASDPAALEKATNDFATKFPDSELTVLMYRDAMHAYQTANNADKMLEMGRKVLKLDKDDPEALIGVAEVLTERTRDTDLDKAQRMEEAVNDANHALETIDTDIAVPPNTPQERIDAYKNFLRSGAYAILGTRPSTQTLSPMRRNFSASRSMPLPHSRMPSLSCGWPSPLINRGNIRKP